MSIFREHIISKYGEELNLPKGSKILTVKAGIEYILVFTIEDEKITRKREIHTFRTICTGEVANSTDGYLGTVLFYHDVAFHVFHGIKPDPKDQGHYG